MFTSTVAAMDAVEEILAGADQTGCYASDCDRATFERWLVHSASVLNDGAINSGPRNAVAAALAEDDDALRALHELGVTGTNTAMPFCLQKMEEYANTHFPQERALRYKLKTARQNVADLRDPANPRRKKIEQQLARAGKETKKNKKKKKNRENAERQMQQANRVPTIDGIVEKYRRQIGVFKTKLADLRSTMAGTSEGRLLAAARCALAPHRVRWKAADSQMGHVSGKHGKSARVSLA